MRAIVTGGVRYFVVALLLIGAFKLPYGYYTFLRIVVTLYTLLLAFYAHDQSKNNIMFLFMGIAILFNPLIPVYLSKDIWKFVDIVTAVLFIAIPLMLKETKAPLSSDGHL